MRGLRTIGKRLADRIRSANLELKILRASGSGVVPPYKIQTLTRTIRTQTQRREFVERLAGALEKFLAAKGQETRR